MSKVSIFGKFTCAEGKQDEMQAALVGMVDAGKTVEGIEINSYHKDDSGNFWYFGLMSSAEVAQQHSQTDAMKEAMAGFMPLLAAPPEMAMTTPIASDGLDL